MKILLVEDDVSLGYTLQEWLRMDGYAVDWLQDGASAAHALLTQAYDCVLLDRGLPKRSGDSVLRDIRRQHGDFPVLLITAMDTLQDKVEGLDLGADDYLVKPFELAELSARLRVMNRRMAKTAHNQLHYGEVCLDLHCKTVTRHERDIALTAKEFQVLKALMLQPEQVLTRQQLEDKLYCWGSEVESNAIEVHIHHLRKKLGSDFIRTIRHLGYTLNAHR